MKDLKARYNRLVVVGFCLLFSLQCANIFEEFSLDQSNFEEDGTDSGLGSNGSTVENRDNFLNLKANIYIAGSVEEGNDMYAGYWYADKQGFKRVNLDKAVYVYDIAVEGNIIYAAGENENGNAAVWKNGVMEELTNPGNATASYATGIDISNGDVYVSGVYTYKRGAFDSPASIYWVNGSFKKLTSNADSEAFDIVFHNNKAISVGWYMSHHNIYACYWVNQTRKNLHGSGDGEAYKIISDGNNHYIAGWTASNKSMANVRATYWTNGRNKKRLSKGTRYNSHGGSWSSEGKGIARSNNKIYIAGKSDYYNLGASPAFWEGNTIKEPFKNSDGTQDSVVEGYISDIAVFEGNVITAGIIDGNLSSYYWDPTKPSVWVNGVRYPIESNSITYSEIESILVVPH